MKALDLSKMLSLATLAIVAASILQSCATCELESSLYVRDTLTVEVNKDGVLQESSKGTARYALRYPGDSFTIEQGRPFILEIPDAIDLGSYALAVSKINPVVAGVEKYRVGLLESCRPYIEVSKQCQVVNWYNPYRLPEIRVRNSDHQVVTTPLLSSNNEVIGFEVRLGTEGEGCASQALKRFEYYRDSVKASGRKESSYLRSIRPSTRKEPRPLSALLVAKPRG
jgi:hypothetical protein